MSYEVVTAVGSDGGLTVAKHRYQRIAVRATMAVLGRLLGVTSTHCRPSW